MKLLKQDEVSPELRELFILSGYRPTGLSNMQIMKTIGCLHNETMNVWTNAISLIHTIVILSNAMTNVDAISEVTRIPVIGLAFSTMCCFIASIVAHLYCCKSVLIKKIVFMVDYCSIIHIGLWMTCGYIVYLPEHLFYLQSKLFHIMTSYVVTLGAGVVCCWSMACKPHWERGTLVRVLSITVANVYGALPALQIFTNNVSNDSEVQGMLTNHLRNAIILSIIGGFFLSSHFPERCSPGRFDIFGCSHQFFHIVMYFSLYEHMQFAQCMYQFTTVTHAEVANQAIMGVRFSISFFAFVLVSAVLNMCKNDKATYISDKY